MTTHRPDGCARLADTNEVLAECGYSTEEIRAMYDSGAAAVATD